MELSRFYHTRLGGYQWLSDGTLTSVRRPAINLAWTVQKVNNSPIPAKVYLPMRLMATIDGRDRQSFAYLWPNAVQRAIVLVHGFGGDPHGTWHDFIGLCDTYAEWANTDLYLYGYSSPNRGINVHARNFEGFLSRLVPEVSPAVLRLPWYATTRKPLLRRWIARLRRTEDPPSSVEPRTYSEIILAGHSEGGLVIRRCLLNLLKAEKAHILGRSASSCAPLFRNSIRLFAPALLGTNFSGWPGFFMELGIINAFSARFAARNDMRPNSRILTQIEEQTCSALRELRMKAPESAGAFIASIIAGENDQIVTVGGYDDDDLQIAKDHDHFSICKPRERFRDPITFVDHLELPTMHLLGKQERKQGAAEGGA